MALRLLRHCGSYCKVVHNMRTTPPDHQLDALQRFDTEVRETFGLMTGLAPTDSEWDQAARGMAHAGLALYGKRRCTSQRPTWHRWGRHRT